MTLLPFLNQFIVPTVMSLYLLTLTFFPHTTFVQQKTKMVHKNTLTAKKIISPSVAQTPISSTDTSNTGISNPVIADTNKPISNQDTIVTIPTPTSFSANPSHSSIEPTISSPISQVVNAKTTISASGKTIYLTMQYPSGGGAITGGMSGDCSGSLTGVYSGPTDQTLSGHGTANCPIGFISIPVDITYSGKLTSVHDAQITYTVQALGKTDSGTTDLSLTQ